VVVYVKKELLPLEVLSPAKETAISVFAGIEVPLAFRDFTERRLACACISVEMFLYADVPVNFRPGTYGYSLPFADNGTRIHILCGRVRPGCRSTERAIFLGHLMAHEIAHVVGTLDYHSEEGLMKARWTAGDFQKMLAGRLPFDPVNAHWIHEALERQAKQVSVRR
jgi:hypothetical protein